MAQRYVFISYSSQNRRSAIELKNVLENNGISCWMDLNAIPVGGDFGTEISKAIDDCSAFVLLLSKESQKSKWVPKELDYAISSSKPIIPVHIDSYPLSEFKLHLANVQCINAYNNKVAAYETLVAQVFNIWHEIPGHPFALPQQKKPPVGKLFLLLAVVISALALLFIPKSLQHEHAWAPATCISPKICTECGAVEGFALGHQWIDATYDTPKTCSICEITEGTALVKKTTYLNDLPVDKKYGKLWLMGGNRPTGTIHTVIDEIAAYDDYTTAGYSPGPVYDHRGNQYERGWFVDGNEFAEYYVEYDLGGKYTSFSFTYAMTADMVGNPAAQNKKQFMIYGDGELLFESNEMSEKGYPQSITISVEGVKTLRIEYPRTPSPSRICAIFDGKFT